MHIHTTMQCLHLALNLFTIKHVREFSFLPDLCILSLYFAYIMVSCHLYVQVLDFTGLAASGVTEWCAWQAGIVKKLCSANKVWLILEVCLWRVNGTWIKQVMTVICFPYFQGQLPMPFHHFFISDCPFVIPSMTLKNLKKNLSIV